MGYKLKKNLANKKNYGDKRSTSKIKWIVIHATGNDGDTDENNGKYFENNVTKTSAHYFVDDDSVTQSVPDNYVAYSVGGSKYNNNGGKYYGECTNANSISIELCDDVKNGKVYPSKATIENAIDLAKKLMKKYNIPQDKVIRHYDVNGKPCPVYWCGTDAKDKKWKTEFWNKLVDEKKVEKAKKETEKYYKKYTGKSTQIDVVFKAIGVPEKYRGSAEKRKPIAKKNGYLIGYKGASKQNLALIKKATKGKLKKA